MRLPLVPPSDLTDDQKPLYADMKSGIEAKFDDFQAMRDDGALMGPWNPWLHAPKVGGAIWELTKAMSFDPQVPATAREIAILVTGAHFNSAYEIYAHVAAAEEKGLDADLLATLVAGVKPEGLNDEQEVAYEVATSLLAGAVLPRPVWDRSVRVLGEPATHELIYLVGLYCLVSVTLNGFNVPVPDACE